MKVKIQEDGIMEGWNNGFMKKYFSFLTSFQYSTIPKFNLDFFI